MKCPLGSQHLGTCIFVVTKELLQATEAGWNSIWTVDSLVLRTKVSALYMGRGRRAINFPAGRPALGSPESDMGKADAPIDHGD
jgi:hypothetical protein